jgi:single-strand DNA-binding protein
MSKGFSLVVVEGGLGKDPETRSTPTGVKIVNFSIAFERGFGDKAHTCWMDVVCFGDSASFAEKYLKRGKSVRVVGELDVRSWDDKTTGAKRYKTEIVADKLSFTDSGSDRKTDAPARQAVPPPTRQQAVPQTRAEADPFADPEEEPF